MLTYCVCIWIILDPIYARVTHIGDAPRYTHDLRVGLPLSGVCALNECLSSYSAEISCNCKELTPLCRMFIFAMWSKYINND